MNEHTCLCADPTCAVPCTALKRKAKRKTQVTNHLLAIKRKRGDASHPMNDALWQTPIVINYYLVKRPIIEYDARGDVAKVYHQRAYQKRLDRERTEGERMEAAWRQGEITAEEYRTILVGNRRIRFDKEQSVAKEVQAQLNAKIAELRLEQHPTADSIAHLHELEDSQAKCAKLNQEVQAYKDQLVAAIRRSVAWFSHPNLDGQGYLESNQSLFEYSGCAYPTNDDPETFYFWVALLTPWKRWSSIEPWSDENIRHIRGRLQQRVERWLNVDGLAQEEREERLKRQQYFNSACDKVKAGRDEASTFNDLDAEVWKEKQQEYWLGAQAYVTKISYTFTGGNDDMDDVAEALDQFKYLLEFMDATEAEATMVANNGLQRRS